MTDEGKPLLCVRSHPTEPESDVSIAGSFEVPSWRLLPGFHQATAATASTSPEMVPGTLVVGSRKKSDPELDTPTVRLKQSSHTDDLPPATHRSVSPANRPVHPDSPNERTSLLSVGQFGCSETNSPTSVDHATKTFSDKPRSLGSMCLSRSYVCVIISIVFIIIIVALMLTVTIFAELPSDIHTSTEVYNVNNDTVLAVQFDRMEYNAVALKHIRRDIVRTHTVYIYSQNCKTLTVYNQTDSHTLNHSINISDHTLVSDPIYLLSGSRMQFNVTILNVPSIATEIYLYIFNDLDILFTYYYEQNLGKSVYKSQVYTHGSGSQSTITSIEYTVTERGYWFAAILCDTPIEMEYSSRFYKVLYDRSKLQEKCVLEDMDSCEVDYSFSSTSQMECVLCYVTAPAVVSPDPAYVTATVTRRGETPLFYGALGILIFCTVIISITCGFVTISTLCKSKRTPL